MFRILAAFPFYKQGCHEQRQIFECISKDGFLKVELPGQGVGSVLKSWIVLAKLSSKAFKLPPVDILFMLNPPLVLPSSPRNAHKCPMCISIPYMNFPLPFFFLSF